MEKTLNLADELLLLAMNEKKGTVSRRTSWPAWSKRGFLV